MIMMALTCVLVFLSFVLLQKCLEITTISTNQQKSKRLAMQAFGKRFSFSAFSAFIGRLTVLRLLDAPDRPSSASKPRKRDA
jgi:hypothetical protein